MPASTNTTEVASIFSTRGMVAVRSIMEKTLEEALKTIPPDPAVIQLANEGKERIMRQFQAMCGGVIKKEDMLIKANDTKLRAFRDKLEREMIAHKRRGGCKRETKLLQEKHDKMYAAYRADLLYQENEDVKVLQEKTLSVFTDLIVQLATNCLKLYSDNHGSTLVDDTEK